MWDWISYLKLDLELDYNTAQRVDSAITFNSIKMFACISQVSSYLAESTLSVSQDPDVIGEDKGEHTITGHWLPEEALRSAWHPFLIWTSFKINKLCVCVYGVFFFPLDNVFKSFSWTINPSSILFSNIFLVSKRKILDL